MNLYLAGIGGIMNGAACRQCERGCNALNLYLAESGGVWNAYFKERREDKLEYTVQDNFHLEKSGCEGDLFKGTNILQSFYYANDFTTNVIIPQCENFMLDSGAFTFFSSGNAVDWNEYIKKYAAFIKRNNVKLYYELDIDSLIGYEKVLYYRAKLEDLTGTPCIPVWHKSRGQDEFIKMCEQYKYVALGGIVSKEITQKEYKYFPYFINTAHKHGAKIHALGFTNLQGLTKYHFDSVDSTAWVSGNRFGSIYIFNGKTMVKHDKKEGQRLSDARTVALHNFREWVKFQKYAEKYL